MSLTERKEGTVAAAADSMVAVAWGGDPVDIVALVAAEPNQTEVAAEPNGGVVAPVVVVEAEDGMEVESKDRVGVALGVLEEAVLAAVCCIVLQCAAVCSSVLQCAGSSVLAAVLT